MLWRIASAGGLTSLPLGACSAVAGELLRLEIIVSIAVTCANWLSKGVLLLTPIA